MLTFLSILLKRRALGIGIILLIGVLSTRLAAYSLFNQANITQLYGEDAITIYQRSLALAPNDFHIRWQLARAALALNNNSLAASTIEPITDYANHDSLLFTDVLRILAVVGLSDRVIDLYEKNRDLSPSAMVSDTVALAYIEQDKLEEAFALRPTDLYLISEIGQLTQTVHNSARADTIHEKLIYFPPSAIDPVNERILKYMGETILSLLESKIWTREEAINVIDYLVWKHYRAPEVEQILQGLRSRYPNELIWQTLTTALAQRRTKAPALDSWLPLNSDEKATRSLVKSTRLNTFNRLAVARDDIFWHWYAWEGKERNNALFFADLDPLESNSALRIMSLWQRPSSANEVPPYAEYKSEEIILEPNTEYTLTLRYKNDKLGRAIPFIALLEYVNAPRFTFVHTVLPSTAGDWQTWQATGKSYTEPIKARVLLRMLGTGSVWFDNIQLIKGNLK